MNFHHIKQVIQSEHTLHEDEWEGAVLFLCNEDYVFFIKRSENMPTHGGQMAFVGGHRQSNEVNPWDVAQREFEEETNLSREDVEFLGFLPVVLTARLRPIIPVMGRLLISTDEFFDRVTSNGEWDDVIAYPWKELIQEDSWEFAWRNGFSQTPVLFHPIRRNTFIPLKKDLHTHLLWGATASMVWDFLRLYYRA